MVHFSLKLHTNIFKYRRKSGFSFTSTNNRWFSDYKKYKILFFGTDNFSLPSLKKLNENYKGSDSVIETLEVVTSFKATVNPVKNYATQENLVLHKWTNDFQTNNKFDLGLVVSFGHLLPKDLIESFTLGMLNIHASLLPKLRGASPIIHALKDGLTETGVSLMKIRPDKFDIGEILSQKTVRIGAETLMPELHYQLAKQGADMLVDCLKDLPRYYELCWSQNNSETTYAPKITKDFTVIRWTTMSAKEVFNLYRSLYSFKPLLTIFKMEPVKIIELDLDFSNSDKENCNLWPAGTIEYSRVENCLKVMCADQRVRIFKLSIGKKKVMSAVEFYNGYLSKIPAGERCFNKSC